MLSIGGASPETSDSFRQARLPTEEEAAGKVRVPGKIVYPSAAVAVAELRKLLVDISLLDQQQRSVDRRLRELRVRLADPAHFGHPRREGAEQRHEDLVIERGTLNSRLQAAMLLAGDIFLALPESSRRMLVDEGWAPVRNRFAMRIWLEACLETASLPNGEAPF